ncbi:MAG TPA: MFS transporter [Solirubrobacterales bacterium]|jgi:sugar phosphate permease
MLTVGVVAQAAGSVVQFSLPFCLPQLRDVVGGSLPLAALVASCPTIGLALTLFAWGWVADVWSERLAMASGLLAASLFLVLASLSGGTVTLALFLLLAGAAAASVNVASGRIVLAWFEQSERGLAMGIRQTAQPLGVGVAALAFPLLVSSTSLRAALLFPAAGCLTVAALTLLLVSDSPAAAPPSAALGGSPYRRLAIWRVHGASALLSVPQYTVSTFGFLFLVESQGLGPGAAGALLAATQLLGAAARLGAGRWSDLVGSRLTPMRALALANAVVMAALAATATPAANIAAPFLVAAAIVTVSGNGLAFTAAAEIAGESWAGRAMGVQNTAQNVVGIATPVTIGALIAATSFAAGFAVVGAFPLAAALVLRNAD